MKFCLRLIATGLVASFLIVSVTDARHRPVETVYTLSNQPEHNTVLSFQLKARRKWVAAGEFDTGGQGSGTGLGNQGALALSRNQRYLFAVNPGSNDVSVFRVREDGLELLDRAAIIGEQPVSIAVDHNLVYVVNALDDSIFGLRFNPHEGKLRALPESYRSLSTSGTAPAQISFNPEGDTLVVTEKATNTITTFALDASGLPLTQHQIQSAGITPFGFAFGKRDQFFVSEANGLGTGDGATVSSYQILDDGLVSSIDAAVAVNQTAACWLVTTPNGRIAYTANTPANSLSSFRIDPAGNMTLLETIAATRSQPRDLAMNASGRILFTLDGGDNTIGVFRVSPSGELRHLHDITGLPEAFTGLIVR